MRSLRLLWLWLWLGLGPALSGYVVFVSLTPHPETLPLHYWDKAEHATAYGVLALWFDGCLYDRMRYPGPGTLLLALGIALEFIQARVGRDFQVTDMCAPWA